MAKRGSGEGSIFQTQSGLWAAAISLRIEGKRLRRVAYAKTRREAADKLKILLDKSERGIAGRSDETLHDYLNRWLELVRPEIKPRSHAKFEAVSRLHVLPHLGNVKLGKLTGLQIQELINAKIHAGMAPQSVLHVRNTLRNALNRAIRLGLIDRNPAAHVEVPRLPQTRVQPLSPEQCQRLLEAAQATRLEAFYVTALCTGARRGELLGLKWPDLDLDSGRLTIARALQRVEGQQGLQLTETKSVTANRTIILPKFAIAALRAHRARQLQERLISGPDWRNADFVFTGRDGQPLEPITLHRDFKALLARAGLPATTRIHDLRHSAATLLLAKGVPLKLIQNLLGHSSLAITSAFYAHVGDELKQTAADVMDSMFNR